MTGRIDQSPENAYSMSNARCVCSAAPTDEELLKRAVAGQRAAAEELFQRHKAEAYGLAYHLLRNHADADDAVQNGFLKAHARLRTFRGAAAFKTWLLRIVSNAAADLARKARRQTAERRKAAEEWYTITRQMHQGRNPLEALIEPEEELDTEARAKSLDEAIQRVLTADIVTPRMRKVLSMRRKSQFFKEIAGKLKCCEKTVRADMARVKRLLRAELLAIGFSVG